MPQKLKKMLPLYIFFLGLFAGSISTWRWSLIRIEQKLDEQRRSIIETVKPYLPPESQELRSLNGYIERIENDKILLRADRVHAHPFEAPGPEMRTIVLTADTVIYRRSPKEQSVLKEEEKKFFQIAPEERDRLRLPPPDPFAREEVPRDKLFVGQRITVFANENVKYANEFTAAKIEFRED